MASTHKSLLQMIMDVYNNPMPNQSLTYWLDMIKNIESHSHEVCLSDYTKVYNYVSNVYNYLSSKDIEDLEIIARTICLSFYSKLDKTNYKHKLYEVQYIKPITERLKELS